jgi:hypothetical protein
VNGFRKTVSERIYDGEADHYQEDGNGFVQRLLRTSSSPESAYQKQEKSGRQSAKNKPPEFIPDRAARLSFASQGCH